jgi:two-component system KDP operon response regulator KdpE
VNRAADSAAVRPVVLVIEDEQPIRRFLRAAFESADFRMIEAENAREGLAQATSHAPDLIVLDLGLPDMDGIEVTEKLREWYRADSRAVGARAGARQDSRARCRRR